MNPEKIREKSSDIFKKIKLDLGLSVEILKKIKIKPPVLVKNIELTPSYWFIPLEYQGMLAGFIRVSQEGKLLAYGRYSKHDNIPINFLEGKIAKKQMIQSFREEFDKIGDPNLIHDGPPERLTWMATGKKDGKRMYLFWPFYSPYSRENKEIDYNYL